MPYILLRQRLLSLLLLPLILGFLAIATQGGPVPVRIAAASTLNSQTLTRLQVAAVTASSDDGNMPANTLDRDLTTRWSAYGDGQWISYDLGSAQAVGALKIAFYKGDTRVARFDIEISTDNSSWTKVYSGQSSGTTLQLELFDITDLRARYVRIVGHGHTAGLWNSLTEVELYSPVPTPLQVTSVTASSDDGNVPANTLDGNLDTRWSAQGDGQWIQYDLGSVQTVSRLDIAFYLGSKRSARFEIATSTDGGTFTEVYAGASSGTTDTPESFAFPAAAARFVRVIGHGNTSNDWNSLTEVMVFGVAGSTPTPAPTSPPTPSPTPSPTPRPSPSPTPSPLPSPTPSPSTPPSTDPVLVGAGDTASCSSSGDEATAKLLDGIPGTVFTTGDNAYVAGTASEFSNCYAPSWGRHKARTRPSVGNHEYGTSGASGYFQYFGAAAGDPTKGYYSYDLGAWHIVVLNSNCAQVGGCQNGSSQEQWLRADLAAHPAACTVAYMHHPRFSSGQHGNATEVQPLWQTLYAYGADVVLAGHDHGYERFAPQDPSGRANSASGIREFVVGSGGKSHYGFSTIQPNSVVRNSDTFGVLKLTLHATSYDWKFVPEAGKTFTDSGSAACH